MKFEETIITIVIVGVLGLLTTIVLTSTKQLSREEIYQRCILNPNTEDIKDCGVILTD